MAHVDELSATDRAFLDLEGEFHGMHVGAVVVLGPSDLIGPDGAVDFARLAALVGGGLDAVPRFRQKVARIPGLGAGWVDDPDYRVEHHVHRAAVPRPGGDAELFALAGALFSRALDERRPLWELWLVEGLAGGRLALVVKAHHSLVDGIGGIAVLASIARPSPEDSRGSPRDWQVSPPTRLALARALATAHLHHAGDLVRDLGASLAAGPAALGPARDVVKGLVGTLRTGLSPASATLLNPPKVGPTRSFAGLRLDLARIRTIRKALGGTVNDVALAVVTGGLRRTLARMGDDVDAIRSFRALVPVNLRVRTGEVGIGNHISLVLAELPIAVPDARARYERVRTNIARLKQESHEIEGAAYFEKLADLGGPNLVSITFSIAMRLRAFNVVVTDMAGPQARVYVARSQVEALYPLVPLFSHQAIGVAILGYAGALHFGLQADEAVVPDLDLVCRDFEACFDELCEVAAASASAVSAQN